MNFPIKRTVQVHIPNNKDTYLCNVYLKLGDRVWSCTNPKNKCCYCHGCRRAIVEEISEDGLEVWIEYIEDKK